LHANLQLFRGYQCIKKGYQILQQSNLPEWLKDRWRVKPHMLTAISQGKVVLEVNVSVPIAYWHKPVDEKVALMEAWPNLVIYINRNSSTSHKKLLMDTISLQALVPDYRIGLQSNGKSIGGQEKTLAVLEMLEIFLTVKKLVDVKNHLTLFNEGCQHRM